jgi:hypothetical protein
MSRKLALFVLLALSLSAFARTRSVAPARTLDLAGRADGATISGTVTSVQGNLIRIADGLITIDATGAKVIIGRGEEATVANIEPGMLVFATLRDVMTRADGPLLATLITATPASDVAMTGVVENVDVTNRRLTLLQESVLINDDTSFGGFRNGESSGLASIQRNQIVHVQADVVGGQLIAREVLVLSPVVPQVGHLRGTVTTIGANSWVVRKDDGENVTLGVDARTRIAGSPKVGDKVEVLYRIDSANAFVALTIIRFEPALPPSPSLVRIHGNVKAIEGREWTVRENGGADQKFFVTDRTQIVPGIVIGDRVEVLALRRDNNTYEALTVIRLRF